MPYSKKRTCAFCEKEYDAPSPQSRVCSDKCKKEVRKRAYTKHNKKRSEENRITHKDCVYCNKRFKLKSVAQRYCSEKCKRDAGVVVGIGFVGNIFYGYSTTRIIKLIIGEINYSISIYILT